MNRFLLTADWHVKKGIRVQIILDYLSYIEEYYFKHELNGIFVLGDIFDKSSSIKNETFIPIFMKLLKMKEKGITFVFIVGNHDVYNIDNDSIVETFTPIGKVIKDETNIEINGRKITLLPYTKSVNDIPPKGDILLTHLSIADFQFDNSYHVTEKHAFPRNLFENYNSVFTGHFHRHQKHDNIVYTGSPCQMNKGESGQKKGFIVFDLDRENWDFIEYNNAPSYITIDTNDIADIHKLDLTNKIAVINVDKKIKDFAKLRYLLLEKGAVDIVPVFIAEEDGEIEEVVLSSNLEDTVREYIESNGDSKVLLLFEKVLKEA